MLGKVLARLWALLATLVTLAVLLVNARFYTLSSARYVGDELGSDVVAQLRFVRGELDRGLGPEMQRLFPEGYFFSYALYGLAWVEVGLRRPEGDVLRAEALREARWALGHLDDAGSRAPFSPALEPPFGVFYVGWGSWLRGGTLLLEPPDGRDQRVLARFEADLAALGAAFDASPTPFLAAYPSQAWPVDSTVAMAALRLHDRLLPPRYEATVARWLGAAQGLLDPATGLLPHQVDPRSGVLLDGARGSSQSVIARFLPEIDPVWAEQQYLRFRAQFIATPLGVPGVREHPLGVEGEGDVDSGPLVWGVSASATVVTLGAALAHGDHELASPLLRTTEAVGVPLSAGGAKRYAFGLLPIGDAFLAWAKTGRRWLSAPHPTATVAPFPPVVGWWWLLPFHACSSLLLLLFWLPLLVARRRRRRAAERRHALL